MKYTLVLLFFWIFYTCSFAQILTVLDEGSKQPIELVSVSSNKLKNQAFTDSLGKVSISMFKNHNKLSISCIDYFPQFISYDSLKKNNFLIYLKKKNFTLDEIIISASKSFQRLNTLPYQINKITQTNIQLQNPQTTADLLGASGGVFIQKSQQGGGSPMIRGFSANRLLYVIDGVRMNTAIFRGGNLHHVISIDPFTLSSAEVLFGSNAVIYGSDAVGAVMSFQTMSPLDTITKKTIIHGNTILRYGSANKEKAFHIDLSLNRKKWGLLTSFSRFDFGDLKMGKHGHEDYLHKFSVNRENNQDKIIYNPTPLLQLKTGYEQNNLMQKISFKANSIWQMTYTFHFAQTSKNNRHDRLLRLNKGTPTYAKWYYGPQKWLMNHLKINYKKQYLLCDVINMDLAYQFFEESRHDRKFQQNLLNNRTENVYAYSANIDFEKKIKTKQIFFYGFESVFNSVQSNSNGINILTNQITKIQARYPNSKWSSIATYLSYQNNIIRNMTLSTGLRLNKFSLFSNFDNSLIRLSQNSFSLENYAITGNLGLSYLHKENTKLSFNFSTGFRAPNIDDIGKVFDSEPGSVVVPNPKLKAEYAYNFELGIINILANSIKLESNIYYTLLTQALSRRDYKLNNRDSIYYDGVLSQVQAIQNASLHKIYGIQLSCKIKFRDNFELLSKWSFQQGNESLEDGSSQALRHIPPIFGDIHIKYLYKKIILDLYGIYNGKVSASNLPISEQKKSYLYAKNSLGQPYSPRWLTINFKSSLTINETLTCNLGIENITNLRYRPYSSGLVAPGRSLIISLSFKF